MSAYMRFSGVLIVGMVLLIISGCTSLMVYNERAISLDDVINLSKADAGSDVIISHIDATHSRFRLSPDDIVRLKNEGVTDDVIEYMIETEMTPERYSRDYSYSPYDYQEHYFNSYYYPIYDYYYNPFSDYYYNYPYSYYNYPVYDYNFGGSPYYRSPYVVRRRPGLVGRFYEYYPSVPLYERDSFPGDRFRRPEAEEYDESDRNNNR